MVYANNFRKFLRKTEKKAYFAHRLHRLTQFFFVPLFLAFSDHRLHRLHRLEQIFIFVNSRPIHGNWIFGAKKITVPDRGYVGEVVTVDPRAVNEMLDAGIIPVVTPIATGIDDNHLYNVNADIAAAALAKCLKVRKFALVSDVPGLLKDPEDPRTLLSTLHLKSVQTLKQEGVISGGMLPKIESCEDAIRAGVKKVHLVDGRMAHSLLLEIFTREGVGTEITE